jgi:spermidine synthase
MEIFTEKQPWGATSYTFVPGSHTHFQTKKAGIDLITNSHFGRMLFIDSVLQSSTADEHLYHKPLVKSAMGFRPNPRILVAGGAEGATIREIQNLDAQSNLGVKEIVMVDWDEELVNHMRKSEPWSQGSFDDPRLTLLYNNFEEYIETCNKKFDAIILDLLDPYSEDDIKWLKKQIFTSSLALQPNGRLTVNCGSIYTVAKSIQDFVSSSIRCSSVKVESIFVPSFMETWYLLTLQMNS